ncbi:hypothetical protein EDB81DRAFT_869979 [Dactylonectria macrodidyma]|uniref:2EXR domain-containing protein n=1 Tax=Dactylonectria macrodidyma TaxID=307937 RepID=A0A9P9ENB7_9HYPO|nr:hypothetical protein EDB81DRAFT_869979 [Dactylonectria macrodidyma]
MATFHPFPRLPFEIRTQIWEMTVEPRDLDVRSKNQYETWGKTYYLTSSTPIPGVMQACHESRNLGLYQRAFSYGEQPRYIWANFENDFICIPDTYFRSIHAERLLIRWLRFEGENNEGFFHFSSHELRDFCNLKEIHVICEEGVDGWLDAWEYVYWPCKKKNVRFIDIKTDEMVTGWELFDKSEWTDFKNLGAKRIISLGE